MYYLPILYFYFTYTIFSPFINPVSNKIYNYTLYKITNFNKNKFKKFDLNKNTVGDKLLVYTIDKDSSNNVIDKLQDQIKINKEKYIFNGKCNETESISTVSSSSPSLDDYIVINSTNDLSTLSKFDLDYVIINCDKHIIYKESVFEEFFRYTGINKEKFIKMYNKYENIVLDLNQNEILIFT